jgi:hypothetical protein
MSVNRSAMLADEIKSARLASASSAVASGHCR